MSMQQEGQRTTAMLPSIQTASNTKIKKQLVPLSQRFVGFEEQLTLTQEMHREAHAKEIRILQNQIDKQKTALQVESNNRAASLDALQKWLSNTIDQWTVRIEKPILAKLEELNTRVTSIGDRVMQMEQQRVLDMEEFPKLIDARAKALLEEIQQFKYLFAAAQASQTEKNDGLLVRIKEQSKKLREHTDAGQIALEKKLSLVAKDVVEETEVRSRATELIRVQLQNELTGVKAAIETEVHERTIACDELVQAINHYSAALQDAIKIVNN